MRNSTQHADAAQNSLAKHISGLLLLLLLPPGINPAHGQNAASDDAKESARALRLWGAPGPIQVTDGAQSVKLQVVVNVIAENTSKENLLLLRRTPASAAEELVSIANPAVPLWRQQRDSGAKSNDHSFAQLRHTLDQNDPPDDDVITLGPGNSIGWNVTVQLDVVKGAGPDKWDAIRKGCPCGLKLDLDLWPLALEPSGDRADSGFGKKMTKRWRKKGVLVFTAKQTDPIELKLP